MVKPLLRPDDCDSPQCRNNLQELLRETKTLFRHVEKLETLLVEKSGMTSDELELAKGIRAEYMRAGGTPSFAHLKGLADRLNKEWGIDAAEVPDIPNDQDNMDVDEPVQVSNVSEQVPAPRCSAFALAAGSLVHPQAAIDSALSEVSNVSVHVPAPCSSAPAVATGSSAHPPAAIDSALSPDAGSSPLSATGLGDSD